MREEFKKRDLKTAAARRKNILIIIVVVALTLLLILSAALSIDMSGAMQRINANNEAIPDISEMSNDSETKESWAVSVENRLAQNEQMIENRTNEMGDRVIREINQTILKELGRYDLDFKKVKQIVEQHGDLISEFKRENAKLKVQIAGNTKAMQAQIDAAIKAAKENVVLNPPPPLVESNGGSIFTDLDLGGLVEGVNAIAPKKKKRLHYSVVTVKNSFPDQNDTAPTARVLTKEELLAQNTYEIVTGFSEAYMITGAVAPLFNGGSGGGGGGAGGAQMQPVPVLLEAEGDLIMPNHVIGSVDKCMLIGTANGNASSSSIDIRLEKMSCLVNDGKQIIDGGIQGWIVSESGTPGIPATLVYRAGDYIARVIASGVLEGLSQGFMNAAAAGNYGEGQGAQIYAGGYNGMGQGVSNAFSKLADFYLSLAESVLPTLEAKAGRTVSMVVMGGDKFTLRDINLLDTREVDMWVDEFIGERI